MLVADLVRRKVAVIVATTASPPALAAKAASTTIPIVFLVGLRFPRKVDIGPLSVMAGTLRLSAPCVCTECDSPATLSFKKSNRLLTPVFALHVIACGHVSTERGRGPTAREANK